MRVPFQLRPLPGSAAAGTPQRGRRRRDCRVWSPKAPEAAAAADEAVAAVPPADEAPADAKRPAAAEGFRDEAQGLNSGRCGWG